MRGQFWPAKTSGYAFTLTCTEELVEGGAKMNERPGMEARGADAPAWAVVRVDWMRCMRAILRR